jgi:hypothetical protein
VQNQFAFKKYKITIYRTIILPTVVNGCETWPLTVKEEHKLRVFEKSVLRRILWPKRDKVKEEWRKLHNEKLKDLYSSPIIIQVIKSRRMRGAGHVALMGGRGEVHTGFWRGNLRERGHLEDTA